MRPSDEDGAFTGNRRYREQAHEIPGVSPAIITRLLHNSIFLNLKDLGIELPPYTEEVVELDMDRRAQAASTGGWKASCATWRAVTQRYLSLWLQWALARPNSAFRDEVVLLNHASVPANQLEALATEMLENTDHRRCVGNQVAQILLEAARTSSIRGWKTGEGNVGPGSADAVGGCAAGALRALLPKESWLASFCQAEKAQRPADAGVCTPDRHPRHPGAPGKRAQAMPACRRSPCTAVWTRAGAKRWIERSRLTSMR